MSSLLGGVMSKRDSLRWIFLSALCLLSPAYAQTALDHRFDGAVRAFQPMMIERDGDLGAQASGKSFRSAVIAGRVLIDGEPAPNVLVALTRKTSGSVAADANPRTKSDSEGRFHLAGIRAGTYKLQAIAPGYIPVEAIPFASRILEVIVSDGEVIEDLQLELKRGGVIAGRVIDSKGRPLVEQEIIIKFLRRDGQPQMFNYAGAGVMNVTDDRGEYRIFGLPEGRYILGVGSRDLNAVLREENRSYLPRTFHPDVADESKAVPIEVGIGTESTDVNIVVGESKPTYAIKGRVVHMNTDRPVVGVMVAGSTMQREEEESLYQPEEGEKTNSNGEFTLRVARPGTYLLEMLKSPDSDYVSSQVFCEVVDHDVQELVIRAMPGATIRGKVLIGDTADPGKILKELQPMISYKIRMVGSKISVPIDRAIRVKENGEFEIRGVQPGIVTLSTFCPTNPRLLRLVRVDRDGASVDDGFEVRPGETTSGIRLLLKYASLSIRGEVRTTAGSLEPAQRFWVTAYHVDQTGGAVHNAVTDANGGFQFEQLTEGEYLIRLSPLKDEAGGSLDPQLQRASEAIAERVILKERESATVILKLDMTSRETR